MVEEVSTKEELKRLGIRASITFIQAGVAYWVAAGSTDWKTLLAGAVGAGASVVYNTVIQPYLKTKGV